MSNREIKFRAWHIKTKGMVDWSTIKQSSWNRGDVSFMYEIICSRKPEYELMQFTGLFDKNRDL